MSARMIEAEVVAELADVLSSWGSETDRMAKLVPLPGIPGAALLEITRSNGIVDAYSLTVVGIE